MGEGILQSDGLVWKILILSFLCQAAVDFRQYHYYLTGKTRGRNHCSGLLCSVAQ